MLSRSFYCEYAKKCDFCLLLLCIKAPIVNIPAPIANIDSLSYVTYSYKACVWGCVGVLSSCT